MAKREGDRIVFLLKHRHSSNDTPETVRLGTGLAEPMQRALLGLSGTVVGLDYRGEQVLAAYEPVDVLDLGIVAKIDLSEVRAPFVRTSWIVLGLTVVVVGSGAALFFAASQPIVEKIRESENRFRELFEHMGSGVAVYEAVAGGSDFVFRDFNQAGEQMDRVHRADLLGKRVTAVFPGVREFGLLDVLKRVWRTGRPERHPVSLYKDQRLEAWRENYVYKLSSGELVALYQDVTQQKQAEDALRASRARMRALLDASQAEIILFSKDGVILEVNRAAQLRLAPGVGKKALIGSHIDGFLPVQMATRRNAVFERITTAGELVHFEERLQGRWFDYWFYPVVGPDEQVSEVAMYAPDITERKSAESDLRTLDRAIEQSPVSVVITDPQGNIEYVNPKFTDITGYSFAEVIGKNPRVLKSGRTPPKEYWQLWKTITAGRVWRGEIQNRKKNGDLFWELASIAPVREADGSITHFVAVKEDITQRKLTEEQLRQSQKMQAVGQLTGGIAHDFNNLLAIIMGNLQLLQERIETNDRNRALLTDALWSTRRGAELTRRLLAFARCQSLNPDTISLNEVVTDMADLLRRTLGAAIEVRESLAGDLWQVFVDRGELERTLVNLAVNARDAMAGSGTLSIETRNVVLDRSATRQFADVTPGDYVMLAVTDTGCGMLTETVAQIFEPFFTTKAVGEGSGLGLSMVYGFIKQSGGHISVHSEVGRGTTVELHLPKTAGSPVVTARGLVDRADVDLGDKAPEPTYG